jgi:hypothetical protein
MKAISMLFAALLAVLAVQPAVAAPQKAKKPIAAKSVKAPAATPNWLLMEAMWAAGGPEYRAALNVLADAYASRMDKNCKVSMFVVAPAVQAYRVYTPKEAEAGRDSAILKQVAVLACYGAVGERAWTLIT